MKRAIVAVVKGMSSLRMVQQALELIDAEKMIKPNDNVLIKPNYVLALPPSSGITTNSHVVEGIVKFVKKRGATNIAVGEGGVDSMRRAFKIVGISEIAKKYGVKLVDLNSDDIIEVQIPNSIALRTIGVSRTVLESTCIISVPKLKVHHIALVTLSMKNLMGAIRPKSIMHNHLAEKIVDLVSLLKPKLAIIDGLVGSEKHEIYGRPIKTNVVIAGRDVVAVDSVGSAVMGILPKRVNHIQLAHDMGLGIGDLSQIEIRGIPIKEVRKVFAVPQSFDFPSKMVL